MPDRSQNEIRSVLPPNQLLAAPGKWPVVGEKAPRPGPEPWRVTVTGLVADPRSWTLEQLREMPQVERIVDIHCVTRWSKPGARFGGIPLAALLEPCGPLPEARFLSFVARSERHHSTSLPLQEALDLGALVALTYEGEPLETNHGGPVRMVVPGRYFYKSVKWLETIALLAEDRLGYWEQEAGYHNVGDPWREQRYMAPNLDRRQLRAALEAKDFSNLDLRSLDAAAYELAGLKARRALLRDADFRRANLQQAHFEEANLSNAHLQGADLRNALFTNADIEGADFCGADVRGADFTGASLFGATFCPEHPDAPLGPALFDPTTRIDEAAIDKLTPVQQAFVREKLNRPPG
ncbi:MAG TPA: molybdopterin-dependent oxidoreductase [Chthonomonadaceae bacterium]|nr:molybdopterin-dependent oxidoreductase [Chthonomonadaceae bacterium]